MPLLAAFAPAQAPLLAWGKPVQTNPGAYRGVSPRVGKCWCPLMGPFMNLVLAVADLDRAHRAFGTASDAVPDLVVGAIRYFLVLEHRR